MKNDNSIIGIIIILVVVFIFFFAAFAEQIDKTMNKIASFVVLIPDPWGTVISSICLASVALGCYWRAHREHWPVETEFQNEDKPHCNED